MNIFPPLSPGRAGPGHRSRPVHPFHVGSDHRLLAPPASDACLAGHTRHVERGQYCRRGPGGSRTSPISQRADDRARSMPRPGRDAGPLGSTAVKRGGLRSPGPPLRPSSADRPDAADRRRVLVTPRRETSMRVAVRASGLPRRPALAAGMKPSGYGQKSRAGRPGRRPAPLKIGAVTAVTHVVVRIFIGPGGLNRLAGHQAIGRWPFGVSHPPA